MVCKQHLQSSSFCYQYKNPAPVIESIELRGRFAQGTLDIISAPEGQRICFTASERLPHASIVVVINRDDGTGETLVLIPKANSETVFMSTWIPSKLQAFSAQLYILQSVVRREVLTFKVGSSIL